MGEAARSRVSTRRPDARAGEAELRLRAGTRRCPPTAAGRSRRRGDDREARGHSRHRVDSLSAAAAPQRDRGRTGGDRVKIAHLVGWYFPDSVGGTEVYVEGLCRRLRDAGHDVLVAAPIAFELGPRTYMHD